MLIHDAGHKYRLEILDDPMCNLMQGNYILDFRTLKTKEMQCEN